MLVTWASQTGFAQQLAERTIDNLASTGMTVLAYPISQLNLARLSESGHILFILSTTGEGDAPDQALSFVQGVMDEDASLPALRYGVLALGDSKYQQFCGFGHRVDRWLRRTGATPLFDLVEVDNGDPGSLRHWQHHLGVLANAPELPDWTPASYDSWTLTARMEVNPGSIGGSAFLLDLVAPIGTSITWQAGDIAEIGPRNAPALVDTLLAQLQLPAETIVQHAGGPRSLRAAIACSHLPDTHEIEGQSPQMIADGLQPLPHREYSIASTPADGMVQLLVRHMLRPDGHSGIGSGWLCKHAVVGNEIAMKIRSNGNFHSPPDECPLILIGNGTGIAGLRAHIKARIAAGSKRNWLLFGERNAAHDFFFRDEITDWHSTGTIERLDCVFSRDPGSQKYVQDALESNLIELQAWVRDGACIYVCGSLNGMAPGVDRVLRLMLGDDCVESMLVDGRYRRDVY